jgi:hypothetical protein
MVAKVAAEEILKKWLAPALVGGAAATQSEDAEAVFAGLLAKGASKKGADAAREVFETQMKLSPEIFTDFDSLITSGATQSAAARMAGNQRQGWFIGADGKPRYEISDKDAAIDRGFTKDVAQRIVDTLPEDRHIPAPLGQFLTHDSLFNAYPDLVDTPVMLMHPRDMPETVHAAYYAPSPDNEEAIALNLGSVLEHDRNETVRSLLHEVQHGIQNREGFARGAGASTALRDINNYISNPERHGAVSNMPESYRESLLMPKLDWADRISRAKSGIDSMEAPEYIRRDHHEEVDTLGYLMSAGEAESTAVESRLRMPAKLRASDHGHPYGDMRMRKAWAEHFFGPDQEGPTLFQMIEMLTRE